MPVLDDARGTGSIFLRIALGLGTSAVLGALGTFAYLGTFTRYLADDYCDTVVFTNGSVLQALINRYLTISDRYSNILLVGLSELILPRRIEIISVVMIVLWTVALVWLAYEIRQGFGFQWPFLVDSLLGTSLAFFAILEAPSRFQTIYWRSATATHFAPLVYLGALVASVLSSIRRMDGSRPPYRLAAFYFGLAFIGGGFSEPPDLMLIVASFGVLVAVWYWYKGVKRRGILIVVGATLVGGVLAFLVMFFSPALTRIPPALPSNPTTLIYRTMLGSVQFVWDSIRTLPLPTSISMALPFLLFYSMYAKLPHLSPERRRVLSILTLLMPVPMFMMVATSFSPSFYGASYPEARARFAGCLMLVAGIMLEGAFLGALLAQHKIPWQSAFATVTLFLLGIFAFYPLRTAWNILRTDLPEYRHWALDWDNRQTRILSMIANGDEDLVVPQLPGIEGVKELDTHSKYWVNRCAATFYGVHSISAPPFGP
jgi:hypothetical protein